MISRQLKEGKEGKKIKEMCVNFRPNVLFYSRNDFDVNDKV